MIPVARRTLADIFRDLPNSIGVPSTVASAPPRDIYPPASAPNTDTALASLDLGLIGEKVQELSTINATWVYADPGNTIPILFTPNIENTDVASLTPITLRPGDCFTYPFHGCTVQLPNAAAVRARLWYGLGVCPFISNMGQRGAFSPMSYADNTQTGSVGAIILTDLSNTFSDLPIQVDFSLQVFRNPGVGNTSILRPTSLSLLSELGTFAAISPDFETHADVVPGMAVAQSFMGAVWRNIVIPFSSNLAGNGIAKTTNAFLTFNDFGTEVAANFLIQATIVVK